MTQDEALENIRELGRQFVDSMFVVLGKEVVGDSDLMNGLVAYEMLGLKGEWPDMDESVDIIMRIIYKELIKKIEGERNGL